MGYSGQSFIIDCSKGGLTGNKNIDSVDPNDMLAGTRNINLHENGRRKRGGVVSQFGSAGVSAPEFNNAILGLYDFRLVDGTQHLMIYVGGTDEGLYYGWEGEGQHTRLKIMTGGANASFETFENTLFVADGANKPQTWNGVAAATSDITSVPTDWTQNNYPKQLIKHGRGVSERLWGVGFTDTPQNVYASANGDGNDFSDANTIVTAIETGDGFGIVGGMEFNDNLFCFGKRKTYVIDDSDIDTANWGYDAGPWSGGVAHWRLLVKTPTDMVAMQEDGEIYSVRAAQEYGDYKLASLTRPSLMHNWIKDNLNLEEINLFHGIYDPSLRAIRIFCVRNGQTSVDACLVYFIDRGPKDGWVLHDNTSAAFGYAAASAAIIRTGPGKYECYTGDNSALRGNVWKLEQETRSDIWRGTTYGYYAGFKTPVINCGDPRTRKNFKRLWLALDPTGNFDMEIDWWVDGVKQTTTAVDMTGTGGLLGSFTLGTSLLGGDEVFNRETTLGVNGRNIQFEIYNETKGEDFFINRLMLDYKLLGKEPAE